MSPSHQCSPAFRVKGRDRCCQAVLVSGFSGLIVLNCVICLGVNSVGRTASMTTRTLLLQCTACMSMGVLLGCALWLHPLAAQSSAKDDGTNSITMSPPSENPQGNGGIDYKNAKPMPLPSVPGPTPLDTLPAPPSTGDRSRPPGSAPGSIGTGEQHPQVLMPSQPLPDTNPAQGQR